ncbi:MAG: hypothetical protein EXR75_11880 [Myxococcales bacterium]|nr:hypothetical protein [Myxococcales bacterium]
MARIFVQGATAPLVGIVPGAPDEELATVLAVVAALVPRGRTSTLGGRGLCRLSIVPALEQLGVRVVEIKNSEGGGLAIDGTGGILTRPSREPLDCGRSAIALAALAGWLAAQPFESRLVADDAVARAHLFTIARILRQRGAIVEGRIVPDRPRELASPLTVGPARDALSPLESILAEACPITKTAALISGLFAAGTTELGEPRLSSDATERALIAAGIELRAVGPFLRLTPSRDAPVRDAIDGELPASASSAAALLLAAMAVPGSQVGVRHVGVNRTADGWLEGLRDAGAPLRVAPRSVALGTMTAEVTVAGPPARGLTLGGERAHRAGIALPLLAAMAATTRAGTVNLLAEVPQAQQSYGATMRMLAAFGVACEWDGAALTVIGQAGSLQTVELDAAGDADVAMAAASLALGARGHSVLHGAEVIAERFPRFVATLRAIGAGIEHRD